MIPRHLPVPPTGELLPATAVCRRYSIVDEAQMREEAEKLQAWATGQQRATKAGARVRQFRKRA